MPSRIGASCSVGVGGGGGGVAMVEGVKCSRLPQ